MPRLGPIIALLAVACLMPAMAHAQTDDDRYSIMRPEPWLPPKYKSPRGTVQHVKPVRPMKVPRLGSTPPPPDIVAPQTGITLPNLPTPSPSGPGRTETYQDRAARCAHQAGVYGSKAGDRGTYIDTCINQ